MRRLYHEDVGPDGQVLVRRQRPGEVPGGRRVAVRADRGRGGRAGGRAGPVRTPEEKREIRLQERAKFRTVVPFYDYTFSAPKSVSVLWASLLAAAAEAEAAGDEAEAERLAERAAQVRGAVKRANDRMMAVAEREAAYVRTGPSFGHVGGVPGRRGLHRRAASSSTTAGTAMPQLHVHNAIANRAQRVDGADDKWRALHGQPLFQGTARVRRPGGPVPGPGAGASRLADRAPRGRHGARGRRDQRRGRRRVLYPGEGAAGPGPRARGQATSGSTATLRAKRPGTGSGSRPLWRRATSKDHNPPAAGQRLPAWARQAERSGAGKLASLHEAARRYAAEHAPSELPSEAERRSIIRQAVAAVQTANASWTRSQLLFELGHALPAAAARRRPGGVPQRARRRGAVRPGRGRERPSRSPRCPTSST